ncbi:hypothetical protein KO481_38160 [Nocardia sp. NEAU-G5]|uniref:Uncharacterized protein n=1 Tax=Nocardia albiluteola TaxID=2842303 RepID=A0ABS6BDL8_9NOCA|nr:hypothetical protein [Nocardia albiluteola]MBU3067333.1 hypothetical protein [Nocardia albiluteola]
MSESDLSGYVSLGASEDLRRFIHEFHLTAEELDGKVLLTPTRSCGTDSGLDEYWIHESMLRSQGEFPCAGDAEALAFCRDIVAAMVAQGTAAEHAVHLLNRLWSGPDENGRIPRIWMVGLDIAYHEEPEYWAEVILTQTDA